MARGPKRSKARAAKRALAALIGVGAKAPKTRPVIGRDALQLTVNSDRSGYLTVLMAKPAGELLQIFPDQSTRIPYGSDLSGAAFEHGCEGTARCRSDPLHRLSQAAWPGDRVGSRRGS